MSVKHFVLIFAFILLSGTTSVSAQTSPLYFAGYLGLSTHNDQNFGSTDPERDGDVQIQNGLNFAGALGMRLSKNLRIEGELSYRSSDNEEIQFASTTGNLGGDTNAWIAMLSAYYDFDTKLIWNLEPYVGAGVGYGVFQGDFDDPTNTFSSTQTQEDYSLVWSVSGGLKYRPRSDLAYTMGYRYLDAGDLDFGNVDFEYSSHEFRLGMEWDLPVQY